MVRPTRHRLAALVPAALLALGSPTAWGVILNGSGNITASGSDLGTYLGAPTFYSAGFTGTRATVVNIEGGLPWLGHQSLTTAGLMPVVGGAVESSQSHATGVASVIGGRGNRSLDTGIAYGTRLYGATVSSLQQGGQFAFTPASFGATYATALAGFTPVGAAPGTVVAADVVNSSWAASTTWGGSSPFTDQLDAIVARYGKTVVVAAGNNGSGQNTVNAPAAAFNVIAVGALASATPPETSPNYNTVSTFSSRSPTTVALSNGASGFRAAISLVAPGEGYTVAGYNGPGTVPNWYYFNSQGTSYAAPTVAGAAALLTDVGYARYVQPGNRSAIDGRTIRAVLMNSADKIAGWDNQTFVRQGAVRTLYALDYNSGAGALNMTRAYTQYTGNNSPNATTGNVTTTAGVPVAVSPIGWDFDAVSPTEPSDRYNISQTLLGGSQFTATLTWFSDATYTDATYAATLDSLANLSLEVYRINPSGSTTLVAQSDTYLNNVEHLYFTLPTTAQYQVRVNYLSQDFGAALPETQFSVAWWGTAVIPEPAGVIVGLVGLIALTTRRR